MAIILRLKQWRILAEDVSAIWVKKMDAKQWIDLYYVKVVLKNRFTIDEQQVMKAEAIKFGEDWIACCELASQFYDEETQEVEGENE